MDSYTSIFTNLSPASESQAKQANEAITVTLPDGAKKAGVKLVTTPLEIALGISKGLADKVIEV